MEKNLAKIRKFSIPLTERELAILSCAVTEMQNSELDPYNEYFVVQVVPGSPHGLLNVSFPKYLSFLEFIFPLFSFVFTIVHGASHGRVF